MARLIYVNNRSTRLPRRKKREFKPLLTPVINPFRSDEAQTPLPSVFERRANGKFTTKQEDDDREMLAWLERTANGKV